MVFGKKRQEQQSYQNLPPVDNISSAFNQVIQNPAIPQVQFPSGQLPPIQQNQPVYQQQNPIQQKQAVVIKAEMTEKGEYYYVIVTDYKVNLGDCILENK